MDPEKEKSFRITTFKHAIEGIAQAVKLEPNMKIHLLVSAMVIFLGLLVGLNPGDFAKIIILIGMVIALELTNTAIEIVVNTFTTEHHPAAKLAKDISAGAVLVVAISSILAGILIFIPYLG